MPRAISSLAAAAALVLALGVAACGDDDDETTVTETEVIESTGSTETTDSTETETTTTAPPTEEANVGPEFFSSPTANVGCALSATGVRCDISERAWQPTPPAEPCELDYGQGISLEGGAAQFVCAGDTVLGAVDTLDYGQRAQRGPYYCDSTEEGMTCADLRTGAGFFLSRESYRIF